MDWFKLHLDEVSSALQANMEDGLTQAEADERFERFGPNVFEGERKETLAEKVLHHLKEVPTIILLVAVAISAYMAITAGSGWVKVGVILSIVILNIVLGVSQENRAEQALDALKSMNAHQTTVMRNGSLLHMDASQLVPGDILELQAGDMVAADARLIEASSLQVEESALTGESLPVEKDPLAEIAESAPLGDRLNMVYSGCLVTGGRARAMVTETGMHTEMGKIAGLLSSAGKQPTPLQERLKSLAKSLTVVAVAAGAIIFAVGVFLHGESLPDMLLNAISLAVAAVPETLPIIVTLILASGVQRMVRKNTIIRNIPAVETVGNTSVICSDKTGTLTQNKMLIQRLWQAGGEPNSAGHKLTPAETEMLELLAACTNAVPEYREDPHSHETEVKIIGDPTEAAIVRLLLDKCLTKGQVEKKYPRVFELPFDSTRKLMTTVHKSAQGYISVTKGAFDRIPVTWDEGLRAHATEVHDAFAGGTLRVIAVAVKAWPELPNEMTFETLERGLDFLGLVGMIDPPRPESRRAVAHAAAAGIKTVMITGDHVATASAIAREIGILEAGGRAVTGHELSGMSDADLDQSIRDISVYARVSPEDKIRIVKAWQAQGEVITMTGDGVNDAPALKAADVGAAMGITGTEVSKNAADMIITDDNFATIVDAVAEGRTAYDNIRKTVHFLLSVNFAEILIMLVGVLLGWGAPITSVQLLFINVVSDGIPGFFLSREKPEGDLMHRPPLPKNANLFAAGLGGQIARKSAVFIVLTLLAFYIGRFVTLSADVPASYETGVTMAFLVLSWASVLNIFNVRPRQPILKAGIFSNSWLAVSALMSMAVTAIVAAVPFLQPVFGLAPLCPRHWLLAVGLAALQLVLGELLRIFDR